MKRSTSVLFVAIVAAAGAAVAVALPSQLAPALVAAVMAVAAWFAPRAFVGGSLAVIVLGSALTSMFDVAVFGLLDEIAICVGTVVLPLRRFADSKLPVVPNWAPWFGGFAALGLYSSITNEVPTVVVLQGAFLAVKGILFGVMTAQVDWNESHLRPFVIGGATAIIVIELGVAANLIAPTWWTTVVMNTDAAFPGEFGLPAAIAWFQHPAALSRISVMLAIAVLTYSLYIRASWRTHVLLGLSSASALLTFRAKTLVSFAVSAAIVGFPSLRALRLRTLVPLAILVGIVAIPLGMYVWADVQQYLLQRSARSLLTLGALDVAANHAPWGAGFGRYGSYTASVFYSPEYVLLGFEKEYGMGSEAGRGQFLNDTQWPAILGEAGWIGLLLFAAGIIHISVIYMRKSADESPTGRWVRMTGLAWLIIVLVESIGAPVFTSPPSFALPFFAAGLYHSLQRNRALPPPSRL